MDIEEARRRLQAMKKQRVSGAKGTRLSRVKRKATSNLKKDKVRKLIAENIPKKQIAEQMNISVATINYYLRT